MEVGAEMEVSVLAAFSEGAARRRGRMSRVSKLRAARSLRVYAEGLMRRKLTPNEGWVVNRLGWGDVVGSAEG
ncbi:MAG: hypothetical protein RI897_3560 [Verrucomicrobiota bacterium]|jgi:hypothetical protein